MIEVYPNLFVGSQQDTAVVLHTHGWSIVHACKDPYHRMLLGYTTKAAPKGEYYYAIRLFNRLALNLIDVDDPKWIPDEAMNTGIAFIAERLGAGDKVLVHCNQGQSRGPGLAMYYLYGKGFFIPMGFDDAIDKFKQLYPQFNPAKGIFGFLKAKFGEAA